MSTIPPLFPVPLPPRNPWICIAIIGILGVVAVGGLAFIGVLALQGKPGSGELNLLVGGAMGSLSSFLVQVPRGSVGAPGGQVP